MELKSFPSPLSATCENCNSPVLIHTYFQCVIYICEKCNQQYRFRNNNLLKQTKNVFKERTPNYLPLGTTGTLKNRVYRVIGFAEKKETGTNYFWREYLLFNPYHGYAYLAEYDGHWTMLEQLIVHPKEVLIRQDLAFDRKWFRFFNKYKSQLVFAKGEFCYNVFAETGSTVRELISPPYTLSWENTADEQMWFYGEYMEAATIKKAFNIAEEPPAQKGIGMCQPMKAAFEYKSLVKFTAFFIGLVILLQVVFSNLSREQEIFSAEIDIQTDSSGNLAPFVTPPFEIQNGPTNVEFEFRARVSNSWMEFTADLINETTGEQFEFSNTVEFYSGYEGGESWTEGSQVNRALLSQIPNGKYHINIWPTRESSITADRFSLKVITDLPMYSNMFLTAGIILLFPFITYIRRNNFEKNRWANSNYSPYDE